MAEKLDASRIKKVLAEAVLVEMDVVVHGSIDSTNAWSLLQCKMGKKLPFACFAEQQTQGRGRRGKHWAMLPYSNIALSVAWPFQLSYQQMSLLPLSIALAVVKTLESLGIKDVQIKWPNDIYVEGKKISGVLIETQSIKATSLSVGSERENNITTVIGVGLNYDMSLVYSSLNAPVIESRVNLTDIRTTFASQVNGAIPSREVVASLLLQNIVNLCQDFRQDAQRSLDEFRCCYDFCKNKNVVLVLDDNTVLAGVALGVTDQAELIVSIDGVERVFNSADVSVKASDSKVV